MSVCVRNPAWPVTVAWEAPIWEWYEPVVRADMSVFLHYSKKEPGVDGGVTNYKADCPVPAFDMFL